MNIEVSDIFDTLVADMGQDKIRRLADDGHVVPTNLNLQWGRRQYLA